MSESEEEAGVETFDTLAEASNRANAAVVLIEQYRCPPVVLRGSESRWRLSDPACWVGCDPVLTPEGSLRHRLVFREVAKNGTYLAGRALLLVTKASS